MMRTRGRPAQGKGVSRDDILTAALALLNEGGGQGLTMRALASQLGVTPMSLYHHVGDLAGLLRMLSDRVYAEVLEAAAGLTDARVEIRALLIAYHEAVRRHPQLTLAIFATPEAFAGTTRQITDRLTTLLAEMTVEPILWRDILVDHAHGSGLAFASARDEQQSGQPAQEHYRQALDRLLDRFAAASIPAANGPDCRS